MYQGLQQTLGEVLTISDAELDGLLDCGDEVIDQLSELSSLNFYQIYWSIDHHVSHEYDIAVTPAGSMQAMADITAVEMEEHFKVRIIISH